MRKAHPVLDLTSSNHHSNSFASLTSPGSLAPPTSIPSSIPTIDSLPITPDTARQHLKTPDYLALIDPERSRRDGPQGPLRNFSQAKFLSALTETNADRESVYSQDSACVVFTPKVYSSDAPPKSALTFAAVWDPENGMSTFTGTRLLDTSKWDSDVSETRDGTEYYSYMSDLEVHGHPDCEPHLPSRFSTTTTSTSNYIDVDFSSDLNVNVSSNSPRLQPGDLHPAWVPQIFTLGYTKSSPSKKSKRPEISEPFQLTGSLFSKRPTISRVNTNSTSTASPPPSPSRRSSPSSSSHGHGTYTQTQTHTRGVIPLAPFTRSHTYSPSSSIAKTEPESLRRGFSFGNGSGNPPPFYDPNPTESESYPRPTTPSRTKFTSVLTRMKSQKKPQATEDGWVMVDVTSVIRQRFVKEGR